MTETNEKCSALQPDGRCKHGHSINYACSGYLYHGPPLCVQEDKPFDEETQTVHLFPVRGRISGEIP